MSYLKDSAFTAVKTDAKFEIRYVKGLSSLLSHVSGASSCQDIPPLLKTESLDNAILAF